MWAFVILLLLASAFMYWRATLPSPPFSAAPREYTIEFGGNYYIANANEMHKGVLASQLLGFGEPYSILVRDTGEGLMVSVELPVPEPPYTLTTRDNRLLNRPPRWMHMYSAREFEVVDSELVPRLQIQLVGPANVRIYAMFGRRSTLVATPDGINLNPTEITPPPRLFWRISYWWKRLWQKD